MHFALQDRFDGRLFALPTDIQTIFTRLIVVESRSESNSSVHINNPSRTNHPTNFLPNQDSHQGIFHSSFKVDVPCFDGFDHLGWIFKINQFHYHHAP